LARTLDLCQDVGALCAPAVRLGIEVALRQIDLDGQGRIAHAAETAFGDRLLAEVAEEALDQVEPGTGRGHEVHVKARAFGQPLLDLRVLVGAVVVGDQM